MVEGGCKSRGVRFEVEYSEKNSAPLSVPIEKRVHPYLFRSEKRVQPYLFRPEKVTGLSVPLWKMMQANLDPTYILHTVYSKSPVAYSS